MYKPAPLNELVDVSARNVVMQFLRKNMTEEKTDEFLDFIEDHLADALPWWFPMGIAKTVVDYLLPNVILDAIEDVL